MRTEDVFFNHIQVRNSSFHSQEILIREVAIFRVNCDRNFYLYISNEKLKIDLVRFLQVNGDSDIYIEYDY